MNTKGRPPGSRSFERYTAALVCLALVYFAAGGSFLHSHTAGQETVCHVCQSLHAPALAASSIFLVAAPELAGWQEAAAPAASARNPVSLHHAGRAPPLV